MKVSMHLASGRKVQLSLSWVKRPDTKKPKTESRSPDQAASCWIRSLLITASTEATSTSTTRVLADLEITGLLQRSKSVPVNPDSSRNLIKDPSRPSWPWGTQPPTYSFQEGTRSPSSESAPLGQYQLWVKE